MPLAAVGLWARAAKSGFIGGEKPIQAFAKKIYDQGQKFIHKFFSKKGVTDTSVLSKPSLTVPKNVISKPPLLENRLFWRIFPPTAQKTLAGELRRKAAYRFWGPTFGNRNADRIHLLGFAGFVFTLNQFKKEDSIGPDIRNLFSDYSANSSPGSQTDGLSLQDFELGHLIGKGSNAAVYEAKFKNIAGHEQDGGPQGNDTTRAWDTESDISLISEEDSIDEDFVDLTPAEFQISIPVDTRDGAQPSSVTDAEENGDIIMLEVTDDSSSETEEENNYNLAIKMMFNYGAESSSESIYRAMIRELVPARPTTTESGNFQQIGNRAKKKSLPPHPNIVDMRGAFVDPVPCMPDGFTEYPAALPHRINPDGIGRNKTMFVVMKKYGETLRDYLSRAMPSMETRIKIFAQILEGVVHMVQNGIAHRDLKSDNILLDFEEDNENPVVIITDFGCCLADKSHGLRIPYTSDETDKGGNCALMAPEIVSAVPGRSSYLDFRQTDLWAVGALAYEIFGMENPFYYGSNYSQHLDSWSYAEADLPQLPDEVPPVVRQLVYDMLKRDPEQRPTPEIAANVIHLYLWMPNCWLLQGKKPRIQDIKDCLMIMVAETLLQDVFGFQDQKNVSLQLKMSFLARLSMEEVSITFDYIHRSV